MTISRVTGGPIADRGTDTSGDAWTHTGNVSVIQRAATLGDTGWADNTEYSFDIDFTSSNIKVFIDGVEEFDIDGTFENGSFGFYNFSQPNVRYAGIIQENLPEPPSQPTSIPEPSTLGFLALTTLGAATLQRKKKA